MRFFVQLDHNKLKQSDYKPSHQITRDDLLTTKRHLGYNSAADSIFSEDEPLLHK